MARTREFEIDAALDAAVTLLWRQGYAATSVRQLCDAMGIASGSFYAAFESKEDCFRRALGRYLDVELPAMRPSPAAISAWLWAISSPSRRGRGCLLVNSAVESPGLDPRSQAIVTERLAALEQFFVRCLGQSPSAKDDAALLAATVVSIHVMSRSGSSPAKLRRVANRVLALTGLPPAARS